MASSADEKSSKSTVYCFRLPRAEMDTIHLAAKAADESVSAFLRKAARMAVRGELPAAMPLRPSVNWCVSAPYLEVSQKATWNTAASVPNVDVAFSYPGGGR